MNLLMPLQKLVKASKNSQYILYKEDQGLKNLGLNYLSFMQFLNYIQLHFLSLIFL